MTCAAATSTHTIGSGKKNQITPPGATPTIFPLFARPRRLPRQDERPNKASRHSLPKMGARDVKSATPFGLTGMSVVLLKNYNQRSSTFVYRSAIHSGHFHEIPVGRWLGQKLGCCIHLES